MKKCVPIPYEWVIVPFEAVVLPISKVTPEAIGMVVSADYGVKPERLKERSRCRTYADPRHVSMYLMIMFLPKMSLKKIGKYFNRDHTTVISARNKVEDMLFTDKAFAAKYYSLYNLLKSAERAIA